MAELLTWLVSNAETAVGGLISVVGGFALLATLTPNRSDDRIVQIILDVVNFLGANLGRSKNDPSAP